MTPEDRQLLAVELGHMLCDRPAEYGRFNRKRNPAPAAPEKIKTRWTNAQRRALQEKENTQ